MPLPTLSAPHNWCDRRCARCPLNTRCPIPAMAARDASLVEILQETCDRLEAELRAQGIDPADVPPAPPPSLDEQVLRRAATLWAEAVLGLDGVDGEPAIVVAMKVARVACVDDLPEDTIPNLILIERLLGEVRAEIEATVAPAARARFEERDRTLRGLLAPLFATVGDLDRRLIASLAAAGHAPSPFAIVPAWPSRSPHAPPSPIAS